MSFFNEDSFNQQESNAPYPGVSPAPETPPGFLDYLTDIPMGILRGGVSFGESLAELADSGVELMGGDLFEGNDLTWSEDLLGENKTWVGDLTQGVSQFAFGFIPVAGILGKAGKVGKALKGLRDSKRLRDSLAYGAIVGAPADFIAFNGHEGRLSDLIEQYPMLQNPISAALSSDPDDSEWEGRFKNAMEGLIVGPPAELLLSGLRFLRGAKNAEAKGGIKGREDWIAKNQEKYQEELSKIENPLTLQDAKGQLADLGYKPDEVDAWSALVGATSKRFGVDEDTLVGLTLKRLERGTDSQPGALQQMAKEAFSAEPVVKLDKGETIEDFAYKMQEEVQKRYGTRTMEPGSPDWDEALRWAQKELKAQTEQGRIGTGWYQEKVSEAFSLLGRVHPELSTEGPDQTLFKALLTFSSPNATPTQNMKTAAAWYDFFKSGQDIPELNPASGKKWAIQGSTAAVSKANELVHVFKSFDTPQQAASWLETPQPISRILEEWSQRTGRDLAKVKKSKPVVERYMEGTEGVGKGEASGMAPPALLLGPKVGPFLLNQMGHHQYLTADKWYSRTFRRYFGKLVKNSPSKGEVPDIEATSSAVERGLMARFSKELADELNMDVSDVQANLWYFEQTLWDTGGTGRGVTGDFADGARQVLTERGISLDDGRGASPEGGGAAASREASAEGEAAGSSGASGGEGRLQQSGDTGPRGEVYFDPEDGRAVVSFFESADVSTMVHETGHVFRRNLEKFDSELSKKADEAFGIGEDGWTRAKEEEFTDAFESYLRDGKAPNPTLKKVFENFKAWISDIYRNITGSRLSDRISPEVRDFFDEMLGGRTAKQRNIDVPVKVKEAIAGKLAAVTRGEVELDEAIEGIDLNFDKILADVEAKELMNIVSRELEGQINALKGGVESLDTTAQKALKTLDEDLDADGGLLDRLRTKQADAKDVIAAKMVLSGLSQKITQLSRRMDLGQIDKRGEAQLLRHIEEMAHLQADVKANITEAARITSAGRIPIESTVPVSKLEEIIAGAGGSKRLKDVVQQIKMTGADPRNVMKVVRTRWNTKTRKFINVHNEVWMNSILSGPITHAVNLISTLTHGVARSAEKGVGGLLTGDLSSAREGLDELGGLVFSMKNALKFSAKSLKAGDTILDVGNRTLDTANAARGEITGRGGKSPMGRMLDFVGGIVRTPSRFLTAEDEFNKQLFYRSHLYAKGLADARRLGIPAGPKRTKHVLEYIDSRIDEGGRALDDSALYHAQEGTFTNDLGYGFGKTLQDLVNKHPLARLALPFVRTPTNIFRQLWRHTPGLARFQAQWAADWKGINGPERKALAVGQQVMGMTLLFGGVSAAASGRITGGGPSDSRELALLRQTGWQPYSIVTTDEFGNKKYTSYQRLDPFASAIGLIADYTELGNRVDPGEQQEMAVGMMAAFAKNITNKTYLRGLAETIDVLTDPDRNVERWLQRQAGSYMPNLFNQLNPDDTLREVRSYMDALKARTPGFSPMLDPRRNVFGQPVTYEGSLGPDFVSPFYQSTGLNSAARDELVDLGIAMGQPREKQEGLDLTTLRVAPDQTAYDRWLELVGQVKIQDKGLEDFLNELVQSEGYQRLPAQSTLPSGVDSSRVKLVKRAVERYRNRALMQMLKENPEIKELYQNTMITNRRMSVLGASAAQ